jgi:hypothetical protein
MKPTCSDMIRSEMEEARRVRAFLNGEDISQESPLWLAPGVPSYWNAIGLAMRYEINRSRLQIKASCNDKGQTIYFAVMTCKRGSTSRAGASCSQDRETAIELAFRNSVRQLISQEGVKLVWQDKRKEARRYA